MYKEEYQMMSVTVAKVRVPPICEKVFRSKGSSPKQPIVVDQGFRRREAPTLKEGGGANLIFGQACSRKLHENKRI